MQKMLWLGIGCVPKDEWVLLAMKNSRLHMGKLVVRIGKIDSERKCKLLGEKDTLFLEPTHWMPFPDPPTQLKTYNSDPPFPYPPFEEKFDES